jgi:membrane associated rhomboid family serine protease
MFFLSSSFLFAVFSNILCIFITPMSSIGASGLLYAMEGCLVGFTLANGLQIFNFLKLKTQSTSIICMVIVNIFVSFVTLIQIMQNPEIFLSVGESVNVIAHGVSFLFGFFASIPWYYFVGKVSILN